MTRNDTPPGRLSGNQIVVIALALCAAIILAPAAVYAAKVQKVSVVGTVPTKVKGPVTASVTGTVTTQQAPASVSFAKTYNGSGVFSLTPLFGSSSAIYVTSLTVTNLDSVPVQAGIPIYADAICSYGGDDKALLVKVPGEDTRNVVYPVPVKVSPKCSGLQVLGADGVITITGFRG